MSLLTPSTTSDVAGVPSAAAARTTPPVKIWASIGAVLLAAEVYVIVKWVTGPSFTPVHSGATPLPGSMKVALSTAQIVFPIAALFSFYWFLVRPWRRERRISTDGLLCIAFLTVAPYDSLSDYAQYWFTYNSYLVNFGSPLGSIPGVLTRHVADANEAYPILLIPGVYVAAFIWLSVLICSLLRRIQRRWNLGTLGVIGVCLLITMLVDVVLEGLFLVRMGAYNYAGGHWPINAGHYYQFPLQEMVFGGILFTSFVSLRYFVNDRGETLVERGTDRLRTTPGRAAAIRGLAVTAAVQLGFLLCYHLPSAIFALHSTAWPKDVQSRTYFTDGICGPQSNRACPGPGVPNPRPGAPYLTYHGAVVTPR